MYEYVYIRFDAIVSKEQHDFVKNSSVSTNILAHLPEKYDGFDDNPRAKVLSIFLQRLL